MTAPTKQPILADLICSLFRGRADHIAVGQQDGTFAPRSVPGGITAAMIAQHLAGSICYGFYNLDPESRCYASCIDIDNKPDRPNPQWREQVAAVYLALARMELRPVVELSQSGNGAHVWLFFDEPIAAAIVRTFWRGVEAMVGFKFVEIFPKQDSLSGKKLGNLVRYLLWKKSAFVDVEDEWATLDPVATLQQVKKIDLVELRFVAFENGITLPADDEDAQPEVQASTTTLSPRVKQLVTAPGSLLARRWAGDTEGLTDKSRSAVVQSIACELVRLYVPPRDVEAALRHWCEEKGYQKEAQAGWIDRTIASAYKFVGERPGKQESPKAESAVRSLVPVPISQLGSAESLKWIWIGYLALGHILLFTGLWKAGKTTLIAHLLKLFELGGELIGGILPVRVLYISEESTTLWARRRDDIGISDHVHFLCRPFLSRPSREDWEAFIDHLAGLVKSGRYDLVIFDTISTFWPVDNENDSAKVLTALMPLHALTRAGAAVMLVHHPRKGDGGEGQASRGSGALPGFVDTILELRRYRAEESDNRRRTLHAFSRFDETPPQAVIELGDSGFNSVGTVSEAKRQDRINALKEILPAEPPGMDVEEIIKNWSIEGVPKPAKRTLQSDLKHGVTQREWQSTGSGVKGDPFRYWATNSIRAS